MSTLPTIDSGTLGWVKSEIEDTALQARQLLEQFESDAGDRSAMRVCSTHLHQIYGTLTMVELDGAARLVQESEKLARGVAEGTIDWGSECGSALRRAIDDLTSYLEGLQSKPVPSPLELTESINRLLTARNESTITELELFAPDLSARPPDATLQSKIDARLFLKLSDDLRMRFEHALLRLLNDSEDRSAPKEFSRVFSNLIAIDRRTSLRQLWWIGQGLSEALLDGSLSLTDEIKLILARINEQLKKIQDTSQAAKRRAPPDDLIKRALLSLAYCEGDSPTVETIRGRFFLDEWTKKGGANGLPDIESLNASLINFSSEVEIDLDQVQNLLARYFSPQGGNPETLDRLSTRLKSLRTAAHRNGIEVFDRLIGALCDVVDYLGEGQVGDQENLSMQMAGALLFIQDSGEGVRPGVEWSGQAEASIASLSGIIEDARSDKHSKEVARHPVMSALPDASASSDVVRAASTEVRGELQYVEHALEQVANGEAPLSSLKGVEPHLKRIEGTLEILEYADAATLAEQLRSSLRGIISEDALDPRVLDALAMAVGTLGLCADELAKDGNLDGRAQTIERACNELRSLKEQPVLESQPVRLELVSSAPVAENQEEKPAHFSPSVYAAESLSLNDIEGLELEPYDTLDADSGEVEFGLDEEKILPLPTIDEGDDDIVEIFFEEANEIDGNIAEHRTEWRSNPDNKQALGDLRRGFHTLKGSGRFAKATAIAELAWIVEDLLNRILEEDLNPSASIHEFVDRAHHQLSGLIATRDIKTSIDLEAWQEQAEHLKTQSSPNFDDLARDLGAELVELESSDVGDVIDEQIFAASQPSSGQLFETPDTSQIEGVASVFRSELAGHIDTIATCVSEARRQFPNWELSDQLLRTSHTLRGVLRSVGLNGPARMIDELDALLNFKKDSGNRLEEVDLVLVDQSGRLLRFASNKLGDNLELSKDLSLQFDELASALSERLRFIGTDYEKVETAIDRRFAREVVKSPVVVGDDDELVEAFREEGQEILGRLGLDIERWQAGTPLEKVLSSVRRELHTLKGGARTIGWRALGDLAHNTETLLETADVDTSTAKRVMSLVQEVHDLSSVTMMSSEHVMLPDLKKLDRKILNFDVTEYTDETTWAESSDISMQPVVIDLEGQIAASSAGQVISADEYTFPVSGAQDTEARSVRVNTEILDELVNYAGEVSILRSRLQQQIAMVKSNLGELGETVKVFRDQLRDLEIESEAQMLASNERLREDSGATDFDPLELDRFTRLQTVSRQLGESLGALVSVQAGISEFAGDAENTLQQQRHLSDGLQEGLLRTRMISFASIVPRLRHLIRQTSRELGRTVELELRGEHVEVDRKVLDQMFGSFEHMIRNAMSHGIETPQARTAAGKPSFGTIQIGVEQDGNDIVIKIGDDGRGIDLPAIESRARINGLLEPGQSLNDDELMRILAAPGLTTAKEVTQVSGRGVGMDVVSEMIRQLGGSISMETRSGQGTTFTLRVPVTLAVSHALLVYAGEQMFAVPARLIVNVLRIPKTDIEAADSAADGYTYYNDRRIPVLDLALRLGLPSRDTGKSVSHVIVVRAGLREVGLKVESISDTREVVVKPLGALLQTIPGVSAVTLLGDGSIVLILDIPDLWQLRRVNVKADSFAVASKKSDSVTVMVVDDSMTVRNVMGRDLQNNGYEVILAKDGVDAIEQLRHAVPDILLVDLEMPRMDGFELTRRVRADDYLKQVPILIITSRAGARHRDQAMDLGANGYMSKPYRLDELVQSINTLTSDVGQPDLNVVPGGDSIH